MSNLKYLIGIFAIINSITVAAADAPKVPEGISPLTEAEIRQLFDGKTYDFVAYDEPITGTTTWSYDEGTVSGSYIWKKKEKGKFNIKWFLQDGKSCTQSKKQKKGRVSGCLSL